MIWQPRPTHVVRDRSLSRRGRVHAYPDRENVGGRIRNRIDVVVLRVIIRRGCRVEGFSRSVEVVVAVVLLKNIPSDISVNGVVVVFPQPRMKSD